MTDRPWRWPGLRRAFQLPGRARIRQSVDDELRFHIEGRVEQFMARGMSRAEAEAEARHRFGDYDRYWRTAADIDEGTMRDRDRLELLDTFRREGRHAARALLRSPAFSLIAFITLALGLGATTAIYSILESVVLRPLPYRDAAQLVSVLHPATVPGTGESKWGMSAAGYHFFRRENHTLENLGAYQTGDVTLIGEGEAERVPAGFVTASIFDVLRARPVAGRLITADDDLPNGPRVVVLGWDLWQRRYGGDPAIVGRTIQTGGGTYEIIGVAERGLSLPKPGPFASTADLAGFRVDAWFPQKLDPAARPINSHQYSGIGRLKPGVAVEEAQRDFAAMTARLPEMFPQAYSKGFMKQYNFRAGVTPLREEVLGERIARTLWVLFAAVGLVLLIACANVANLFLVRMEARRRESAIRAALGASRAQMAVHFLAESLLLTLLAGLVGLLVAQGGLGALLAAAPRDIPRLGEVGLRWTSIAFALALSLVAGLVFGLFPLLRSGLDTLTLREGTRGLSHSARQRAARDGLVVAQMALALLLLASAGLMLRSFARLRVVRPGLDPTGVLAFDIVVPQARYADHAAVADFHRELQRRLGALPGVVAVGASSNLPLEDFGIGCSVVFREDRPYSGDEQVPCVSTPEVTPGFLRALGIQVRGRESEWSDVQARNGAVVVTRALAERLWPGQDPIGKGINTGGMGPKPGWYRIVGVVPELRAGGLDRPPTEAVFYPPVPAPNAYLGGPLNGAAYVVRTPLAQPTDLTGAVRRTIAELDPTVPLSNARSMQLVVDRSLARVSFLTLLLGTAATMALLLSAVGIYGVISYVVTQRRTEIGIRMALGARVTQVARLVVLQSVRLAAIGAVVGLAGALAGTRLIRSLLFEVSPTDPVVLGLVVLALLAIAVVASFAPARRAASVDPATALRTQ